MSSSQARVEEVFAEAARLFETKNMTYQDSWRTQGWRGNLSRILEKAGRLRAMLWRGGNVLLSGSREHPRETLLDIINTTAFAIINMDDGLEWGHEPVPTDEDRQLQSFQLSYGDASLTLEDMYRAHAMHKQAPPWAQDDRDAPPETASEQTRVDLPAVGDLRTPGEEPVKPSPRKRPGPRVTDRGSQPRPIKDAPQA